MSRRFISTVLWAFVVVIILLTLIWAALQGYSIAWTGFGDFTNPNGEFVRGKTLWDWLELFVIPIFLGAGAFLLNRSERESERRQAAERAKLEREILIDRQREAAFQAYLDRMEDLLLKENLRITENEEVRDIARTRTLSVLRGLDGNRKGLLVRFLFEARLIEEECIVNLSEADLRDADLNFANLSGARLDGTNLSGANMIRADLSGANLTNADLSDAKLGGANLTGAKLGADLSRANLMYADLGGANLSGANLNYADLWHVILRKADLSGASLSDAKLSGADLSSANLLFVFLKNADLSDANLNYADLSGAKLKNAIVTTEQLLTARLLRGATMPDGTKCK
ncbi:Secreted effector protein PipB2 [Anaerolineales bacterium]|nr:Secreted effector protein PipB2 [Anaerolineales bacterium]